MRRILENLFAHRTLALLRWDIHFIKVRIVNTVTFQKKKLNKKLSIKTEKKFLNLGSGPRGLEQPEWVNIDGFKDKNVDYVCDFNKILPFKENTFDGIFCEHVLEHFDFKYGSLLMSECLRILKPDGIVRIIVPNGYIILRDYFAEPQKIIAYKNCKSGQAMEAVNLWFYQRYEHQQIYDAPYLDYLLQKVGFCSSKQVEYKKSNFYMDSLAIDDEKYAYESLYMEAKK